MLQMSIAANNFFFFRDWDFSKLLQKSPNLFLEEEDHRLNFSDADLRNLFHPGKDTNKMLDNCNIPLQTHGVTRSL